jgi:hypothetical protein
MRRGMLTREEARWMEANFAKVAGAAGEGIRVEPTQPCDTLTVRKVHIVPGAAVATEASSPNRNKCIVCMFHI